METYLLQLASQFGFGVLIFWIWYRDHKQIQEVIRLLNDSQAKLDARINKQDELLTFFRDVIQELKEAIFLVIQQGARVEQKIADNTFCPIVRQMRGVYEPREDASQGTASRGQTGTGEA